VLLSSHLLHEIEVVADDIVMIGNGRIVAHGAKDDLLAGAGTIVRTARGEDRDTLGRALAGNGVTSVVQGIDGLRADTDAARVGTLAFDAGIPVTELRPADSAGLEEMFLLLTSDTQRDDLSPTAAQGAVA
jgi:ABC-2 type transport system ATP-binding protein